MIHAVISAIEAVDAAGGGVAGGGNSGKVAGGDTHWGVSIRNAVVWVVWGVVRRVVRGVASVVNAVAATVGTSHRRQAPGRGGGNGGRVSVRIRGIGGGSNGSGANGFSQRVVRRDHRRASLVVAALITVLVAVTRPGMCFMQIAAEERFLGVVPCIQTHVRLET